MTKPTQRPGAAGADGPDAVVGRSDREDTPLNDANRRASIAPAAIRLAVAADLRWLPDIERAAGELFRTVDMAAVASDELPTVSKLAEYQECGRCWVAVDSQDRPIGYLVAAVVDGRGHVDQVSVDPRFARRGIGRRLLHTVEIWAAEQGFDGLTLTTFTEVAWNGPYYRRCGFDYLNDEDLTPQLRALRRAEAEAGLDRWHRAAMINYLA